MRSASTFFSSALARALALGRSRAPEPFASRARAVRAVASVTMPPKRRATEDPPSRRARARASATKTASPQSPAKPPKTPSPIKPAKPAKRARAVPPVEDAVPRTPEDDDGLRFGDVDVARALASISAADATMAALIRTHGVLPRIASCQEARARATEPNRAFRSLARAIVFQQLNGAAAATIFGRVRSAVGAEDDETAMTPEAFARAKDEDLRACGLSARKLEYLRGLAARFSSGDDDDDDDGRRPALTDDALEAMSDEKTTATLLELKGIGEWSVHMFQMFYLNRPDVLPVKDFGVRQGMMIAYGLRDPPKEEKMREIAASWAPYKTLASMYMWAAADAAKASKGKKETPR